MRPPSRICLLPASYLHTLSPFFLSSILSRCDKGQEVGQKEVSWTSAMTLTGTPIRKNLLPSLVQTMARSITGDDDSPPNSERDADRFSCLLLEICQRGSSENALSFSDNCFNLSVLQPCRLSAGPTSTTSTSPPPPPMPPPRCPTE